jgi:hypothetical protein
MIKHLAHKPIEEFSTESNRSSSTQSLKRNVSSLGKHFTIRAQDQFRSRIIERFQALHWEILVIRIDQECLRFPDTGENVWFALIGSVCAYSNGNLFWVGVGLE